MSTYMRSGWPFPDPKWRAKGRSQQGEGSAPTREWHCFSCIDLIDITHRETADGAQQSGKPPWIYNSQLWIGVRTQISTVSPWSCWSKELYNYVCWSCFSVNTLLYSSFCCSNEMVFFALCLCVHFCLLNSNDNNTRCRFSLMFCPGLLCVQYSGRGQMSSARVARKFADVYY